MSMASKDLGKKLRAARKNKHLTCEAVGTAIGVTTSYYSRIERGFAGIPPHRLLRICETLDLTPEELKNSSES